MDWQQILKNKQQTFNWSDKIPDRKIIDQILDELHNYCPSKQNSVPYKIEVLDWSNKERRNQIFKDTWCESDTLDDRRNPQVLAPYLVIFSYRAHKYDHSYDYINHSKYNKDITETGIAPPWHHSMETGLASMFLVLSAVNHGLDYGFCGCYRGKEDMSITIGLGYAGEYMGEYWNPVLQKNVKTTGKQENFLKPNKSDYIKFD